MTTEILPLFSVPVFKTEINNYNFDNLNERMDSLEYERTQNNDGWMSKRQSLLYDEDFSDIKNIIEDFLKYYLHEILCISEDHTLKHVCSWAIYHDIRDWCFSHLHTNSLFSGVLYTKVPKDSGELLSFSAMEAIPSWCPSTMQPTVNEYNMFNSKTWRIDVNQGSLLLFPSHVLHHSPVSKSIEKRRCIAFNYFLGGKFGLKTAYAEF